MCEYIATFYTHADAIISYRALSGAGIEAHMMPVPRKLSSSCGTCIRYSAAEPAAELLAAEFEAVYRVEGGNIYTKIAESE